MAKELPPMPFKQDSLLASFPFTSCTSPTMRGCSNVSEREIFPLKMPSSRMFEWNNWGAAARNSAGKSNETLRGDIRKAPQVIPMGSGKFAVKLSGFDLGK